MVSLQFTQDPLENEPGTDDNCRGFNNPNYLTPIKQPNTTATQNPTEEKSGSNWRSELDITIASIYVEDALHFRNVPFRPDKLALYQVYQSKAIRYLFVVFPALLLGLALVENPAVKVLEVHWQAIFALELVCLIACASRVFHLRLCLQRGDFWSDVKNCAIMGSILIMFVDMMVWLGYKVGEEKEVIRVSRILRPLLIINFSDNRNLRKLLRNIKKTVVDVLSVLVLIFLFIAIFAMMATKFFERRSLLDPHGDPYLDNFWDSYWNLYVLMTTANSPDVSLPAFRSEQAFFVFFMPFSVITTFVLMNILLAVVYKHYKMHLLEEVKVDVGIIQSNLFKAFSLLKDTTTDHISKNVWLKAYKDLGCPDNLQNLYWDYMVPNDELPGISLQAFFKITDLLSSEIEVVITKKTWLELNFPFIYNSSFSCYLRCAIEHFAFTLVYDVLIVANAIVLSVQNAPAFLEDLFLALFNLEIILKIYTFGPRKFAKTAWNCYDCLVIWSATIFSLVVDVEGLHDTKNEEMSALFLDMVLTLRVLRLLKLLLSIPQLRLIVSTLMQIIPSMGSYALLLFLFYYSYAILGMELFAGKIINDTVNCGREELNGTDFVTENYCVLSFNNILYSFVILWTLTLVNQWHILTEGFVAVTSKASRLYFLSFHVLVVLIILNIFLAFVIEAFMLQIELDDEKQEGIDEHLDERGMNARRESRTLNQTVWYRSPSLTRSNKGEEEDDLKKIYIGTTPLDEKVRYKRQKSTKSYNQLLLDMFQEDIQAEETSSTDIGVSRAGVSGGMVSGLGVSGVGVSGVGVSGGGVTGVGVSASGNIDTQRPINESRVKQRLSSVQEDDPELVETDESPAKDDLSYGSLDMDII